MLTRLGKTFVARGVVPALLLGAVTTLLVAGCVVREPDRYGGYGSYGYGRGDDRRDDGRRDDDRREHDRRDDDRHDDRR